jgi:predicted dehydrogenase
MQKRTYAVVGTGGRSLDYIDPMIRDFPDTAELLAFCDVSQTGMDYQKKRLQQNFGYDKPIATYRAQDFEKMLDDLHPNVVIICTVDKFHHEYIIKAVNHGCDVVCEKPVTIDDEKCRAIMNAPGLARQNVRITFNVRWAPLSTKVKEMIMAGKIGDVKHIQYEAIGHYHHGGSYFSRWHSDKRNSGGLIVHKSTHHFDLANWWIDSIPSEVFTFGKMAYFGRENAVCRGQEEWTKNSRYVGETTLEENPFYIGLEDDEFGKGFYIASEKETGYIYDRNAFREGLNMEDTLSVVVRYRNGALLNYSYIAYAPWAGYRINITGDRGRLEYEQISHAPELPDYSVPKQTLRYLPLFKEGEIIDIPKVEGSHDGGDPRLQEQIFSLDPPTDPFGRSAGYEQGIASAIIGIAANQSMEQDKPVRIDDLVSFPPGINFLHELKR